MLHISKESFSIIGKKEKIITESFALTLLLGFELSYYLLIVQTGITQHYHSDLIALFPLFIGGILGTIMSGRNWEKATNPMHKIIFALSLQLILSFIYPNFNIITLGILGISVGMMAPLSIFIFKEKQRLELFMALAIAYTIGTYSFSSFADSRGEMAVGFTLIALVSAILLKEYNIEQDKHSQTRSIMMYIPLMLWIFLDSNLFETLSRREGLDIWSHQTYTIIFFHLFGLVAAYFIRTKELNQHLIFAVFFVLSYALSYLEMPIALAMVYPFVISYYNVIVFSALTKEVSLNKLSNIMVFIAWIASGVGLALALSNVLH